MTKAGPQDGLYRVIDDDASIFLASRLTGGPWNPLHQHGGAVWPDC
jgi:hypothetical protein